MGEMFIAGEISFDGLRMHKWWQVEEIGWFSIPTTKCCMLRVEKLASRYKFSSMWSLDADFRGKISQLVSLLFDKYVKMFFFDVIYGVF